MINIKQLSHEVGIGVDTLRIWERRYNFPNPDRDSRGHRCYRNEQIEELRVIKKLQVLGFRPNKIFALTAPERRELLSLEQKNSGVDNENLLQLTTVLTPTEIDCELRQQLQQLELQQFIQQIAVPLLQMLGRGWENNNISIAREHLVSDRLEILLKERLKIVETKSAGPTMLFLTLSGERHRLGLLIAALLFQQQSIGCIFLNDEIPLSEVPMLAEDLGVAAVAVSFSAHYSSRQAKSNLANLRNSMSPQIKLVAGGYAVRKKFTMTDLYLCPELDEIPALCKKLFPDGQ